MDAYRFRRILVETVGVGQTELEIAAAADTVVVVLVPESGDAIQAMKAGLMEIADVFVVNKADRPGAERLVKDIRQAMHLKAGSALKDVPAHHGVDLGRVMNRERTESPAVDEGAWVVPVLATTAQSGEGVEALLEAVEQHRAWLVESGQLEARRRARATGRVQDVVNRELRRIAWERPETVRRLDDGVERIGTSEATPYSVAKEIVEGLLR
jgi:LAO/AO transport system kinase